MFALTCAVTCVVTKVAFSRNWQGFEPVAESRWNMPQENKALEYVYQVQPDVVVFNLPSYPWQPMGRVNRRTWPRQKNWLALRQQQRGAFLKTAYEVADWCRQNGSICVGIGEQHSDLWQEPMIRDMFNDARVVCQGTEVAAPKDICKQLQEQKTKDQGILHETSKGS